MKKNILIDLDTIIRADGSFHDHAISGILRIARDLGYSLRLSSSDKDETGFSLLKNILASEGVELRSADLKTDILISAQPADNVEIIIFDPAQKDWRQIVETLSSRSRSITHQRNTKETRVAITLHPDGTGQSSISTGLHFFDHMLDQIARHGGIDLTIQVQGDLHVDEHHTIEDTGIALGEAFALALGDKRGIERYGFCLPMDDALAQVAVDFGGRSWIVWEAVFKREKVGDMPTEMFFHFFKSFSDGARCNLNISATGDNEHHKIEAIFKAFAKAIKMAVRRDLDRMQLPTTKGIL
ncbi:MAG: imidazoleglycerol-phosphate dehydratase HisB [Bacteroidetes bacterium]|nr:imidazoleglycerol-phosphate dehydratase HisB [Bacteroidota bacterium]